MSLYVVIKTNLPSTTQFSAPIYLGISIFFLFCFGGGGGENFRWRVLWENNFLYFYILLFHKFGDGDVVSAWALPQLPDSQNFLSCVWRSGNGENVRQRTGILEIIVNCTDPFDESRTIFVSSSVFNRWCFNTIVSSEFTNPIVWVSIWKYEISQMEMNGNGKTLTVQNGRIRWNV